MINFWQRKIGGALLLALVVLAPAVISFRPGPAAPPPQTPQSMPGNQVVLIAGEVNSFYYVPAPVQMGQVGAQTATFNVNYLTTGGCSPWDPAAQAAFQRAVDIWSTQITSSVPIEINACWKDLGPSVLGQAGPKNFFRDFSGAPSPGTWYPVALANALAGSDLDAAGPDILADFSSSFSNWYFGTDGNTPAGKYDFVTVVLHEIGHGLGFLGSMDVSGGIGSWGFAGILSPPYYPSIYDQFTEDGSNTALLSYTNFSAALGNALTGQVGGGVYFDGPNANAANGGARVKLYTPLIWDQESSYAHLDEIFNNTPNALMTYSLGTAESIHSPGPVMLGIFEDMGWTTASQPDLSVKQQLVGNLDPQPGDAITVTLSIANTGSVTATGVVVTDTLDSDIQSPTWSESSLAGTTERGGAPFIWDLPDLAAGDTGTITVYGTLNPALPSDYAIVNQASIGASEADANTANNSSLAILGGKRVYLPVILRGESGSSGPTQGFWQSGSSEEFYVISGGTSVDDFSVRVSVTGCGTYKITHTPPESISNNQFSFSGAFYASGTFNSATTATDTDGLSSFFISGCGTVSGGPWSWSATWQNSSQPVIRTAHLDEPQTVEAVTAPGRTGTIVTPVE